MAITMRDVLDAAGYSPVQFFSVTVRLVRAISPLAAYIALEA